MASAIVAELRDPLIPQEPDLPTWDDCADALFRLLLRRRRGEGAMRILMLAQFYAPVVGGEERMVEELARALTARGHDVAVATLRSDGLPDFEEQDGVRIHRLPGLAARLPLLFSDTGRRHAPPAPDPETVRTLAQVVRSERPEVVHGHDGSLTPTSRCARETPPRTC